MSSATSLLLVRHAYADHIGDRRIAGRAAGLHLSARGRAEAEELALILDGTRLAAVYTSPLERAWETAAVIARPRGLEPRAMETFTEIDFGDWTGLTYDELEGSDAWRSWNAFRSTTRVPGGESIADVVCRALDGVRELTLRHRGEQVAVVSHGDVIRGLLGHFMGMPLDHFLRIEVDTASVSLVEIHAHGPRIIAVNRTARPPWPTETK